MKRFWLLGEIMNEKYWKLFAYGFFATQTVSAIVLIEMLALGKPYISLFWGIYLVILYLNFKHFAPEKIDYIKEWLFNQL